MDTSILNIELALDRLDNDENLLRLYVELVFKQMQEDWPCIQMAAGTNDLTALQKTSHRLKGSMAGICAERAALCCKSVEQYARGLSAAPPSLQERIDALASELEQLEPILATFLAQPT